VRLAILFATLAVAVSLVAASPGPALAAPRAVDYLALGDSVASGRGLDDTGGLCRRSARAYPNLVRSSLEARVSSVRFVFLACSGATAAGSGEPGLRSLHRQVSTALRRLSSRPALVSLTIGINDFEWSDIPKTYARLREPSSTFAAWVTATDARVERSLRKELARLLARKRVRIVLSGYFNPVNRGSLLFGGPIPCVDVTACFARTDAIVDSLNATLADVARSVKRRAHVRFAGVREGFRGHESPMPLCGSEQPSAADTWIQYPDDPDSNSFPLHDAPDLAPYVGFDWRGDCFHPNDRGAAFIASTVDSAAIALGR